jgi:translation initiation factor 2B subunit (eIF-2B alpha/beta/delta family)
MKTKTIPNAAALEILCRELMQAKRWLEASGVDVEQKKQDLKAAEQARKRSVTRIRELETSIKALGGPVRWPL